MRRSLALLLAGLLLALAATWQPPAAASWAVMTAEAVARLDGPAVPPVWLDRDLSRLAAPLAAAMPTPTASFTSGVCTVKPGFCDTALDVGSGYVVYYGGGGPIYVYNTSGTELLRMGRLTGAGRRCTTWTGGTIDDMNVVYDRQAQRWIVTTVPNDPCIMISQTSDPRGAWWVYYAFQPRTSPDYPIISVWGDAYYQTWNNSSSPGSAGNAAAYERTPMLSGLPAHVAWHDLDSSVAFAGPRFASAQGATAPAAGGAILLSTDGANPSTHLNLYTWAINWTTGVQTFSSATSLAVTSYVPTNEPSNPYNGMMSGRVNYWNRGSYEQIVAAQPITVSSHREAAWYELRNTGSGWAVQQQQQFAPDTAERDYPAINTDSAGNMALSFYHSTNGLSYVGRLVGDTASTMPQTVTAVATSADIPDKAVLALQDDDCTFWAAYGHRVASFKFTAC